MKDILRMSPFFASMLKSPAVSVVVPIWGFLFETEAPKSGS